MFDKLKRLLKNSAIYTLGSLLSRATSLISMPVLTRYLAPGEYGILSVVASVTGSLRFIYAMGMRDSSTRYYYDLDSEGQQRSYFSSLLFFSIATASLLSFLLMNFGDRLLGPLLKGEVPFYPYITVALAGLFFQVLGVLPNTLMRVREQASLYVTVDLVRAISVTALSILFVVVSGMGALGPMLAALVVSILATGYLLHYLRPYLSLSFRWAPVRESLYFGIPTMSERLCWWVVTGSNRLFLLHYVSLPAAGIYFVSYSVGQMLQIIGGSINAAWTPFFYATARYESEAEARRIISYAATYYTLVIVTFALALAIFAREVFHILAPVRYLDGLPTVPWIVLGSMLEALYDIPSRGLYLTKRTRLLPLIMLAAAAVTTACNFALIPTWGMIGAAWGTILGYAVMILLTLVVAQRIYYVPYDYGRIVKIFMASGAVYVAAFWLSPETLILSVLVKAVVLASYPVILYLSGFFEAGELKQIGHGVSALLARHVKA